MNVRSVINPGTITPDPALPLAAAVNQALRPFIGSFEVSTAHVVDGSGNATEAYSTVLRPGGSGEGAIAIEAVVAVIVCEEELTLAGLRAAYERVRLVKALPKAKGTDFRREMTVGLIIARNSQLSLEQISDEMSCLTASIPSQHWPDAVAVLSKGVINYAALVPAGVNQMGDFFLPAPSLIGQAPVPSIFVQKIIRAAGDQTFNKVISLILVRIRIFQPDIEIPNFQSFTTGIPSHGVTTETYQFDLAYALRVMTVEQAVAAQLPRERFDVMSGKKVLGSIQFQPWQDGGVLVVRGNFPIDMLLVFLRGIKPDINPKHLQSFRNPDLQVSFVLPITWHQFLQTLSLFERRSNMRVERHDPRLVVQRFGDEGTTSPFVARLMLGVLKIRQAVHSDEKARLRFDELYEPILSGLRNAREASREIEKSWKEHREKIASGSIARIERGTIYVDEHIDRAIGRELESFLNTTVRIIKHLMQSLAEHHGVPIAFLFKKETTFQAAVEDLRQSDRVLADYLTATRKWSEPLVLMRNALEHVMPPSLKVVYSDENGKVKAKEPTVDALPITDFTHQVLNRVCCFVEELAVYCLKKSLPQGVEITELPLAERDKNCPLRFQLTVVNGGLVPWVLSVHEGAFEET